MQSRALGASGLSIAPIVLGGNVFGWTIDQQQSFEVLDAFAGHGFNCVDTANVYSVWKPGNHGGESETILGNWFKHSGNRGKVVLITKVGMPMTPDSKGLRKNYILEQVENSLRRLQTDYIDLYFSHKVDKNTPIEETLEAYALLIDQGKVRAIGASNYRGPALTAAIESADKNKLPAYTVLQPEYNLYDRHNYEEDLAPVAARYKLGVIPYASLGSGFLTGKYKKLEDSTGVKREGRLAEYFTSRGEKILKVLDELSADLGVTPASLALAWLLAQATITAPIASATKPSQLESMYVATDLKLDKATLDKLNEASAY